MSSYATKAERFKRNVATATGNPIERISILDNGTTKPLRVKFQNVMAEYVFKQHSQGEINASHIAFLSGIPAPMVVETPAGAWRNLKEDEKYLSEITNRSHWSAKTDGKSSVQPWINTNHSEEDLTELLTSGLKTDKLKDQHRNIAAFDLLSGGNDRYWNLVSNSDNEGTIYNLLKKGNSLIAIDNEMSKVSRSITGIFKNPKEIIVKIAEATTYDRLKNDKQLVNLIGSLETQRIPAMEDKSPTGNISATYTVNEQTINTLILMQRFFKDVAQSLTDRDIEEGGLDYSKELLSTVREKFSDFECRKVADELRASWSEEGETLYEAEIVKAKERAINEAETYYGDLTGKVENASNDVACSSCFPSRKRKEYSVRPFDSEPSLIKCKYTETGGVTVMEKEKFHDLIINKATEEAIKGWRGRSEHKDKAKDAIENEVISHLATRDIQLKISKAS